MLPVLRGTAGAMTATHTISVTVKMSESDWDQLARAAQIMWPGAPITKSSLLLTLAKLQAEAAPRKPVAAARWRCISCLRRKTGSWLRTPTKNTFKNGTNKQHHYQYG